jgi:hypothetical protein
MPWFEMAGWLCDWVLPHSNTTRGSDVGPCAISKRFAGNEVKSHIKTEVTDQIVQGWYPMCPLQPPYVFL